MLANCSEIYKLRLLSTPTIWPVSRTTYWFICKPKEAVNVTHRSWFTLRMSNAHFGTSQFILMLFAHSIYLQIEIHLRTDPVELHSSRYTVIRDTNIGPTGCASQWQSRAQGVFLFYRTQVTVDLCTQRAASVAKSLA